MATTATKSTARKTTTRKPAARKPAARSTSTRPSTVRRPSITTVRPEVERAARNGQAAVTEARNVVRTLVAESAYASVGVGDAAVAFARSLPQRARSLSPAQVLDGYVTRGKKVVDSIRNAAPTRRAVDQTKTARSQVKAAVTSVRKAADQAGDAVEHAADKVGTKSA